MKRHLAISLAAMMAVAGTAWAQGSGGTGGSGAAGTAGGANSSGGSGGANPGGVTGDGSAGRGTGTEMPNSSKAGNGKAAQESGAATAKGKQAEDGTEPKANKGTAQTEQKGKSGNKNAETQPSGKAGSKNAESKETGPATKGTGTAATEGAQMNTSAKLGEVPAEKKPQIRSAFEKHRVEPANINVSVNVGVAVPRTVRLYAVPQDVVVIYPAYKNYRYFRTADRIVIVDPVSFMIVEVIVIA